MRMLLVALAVWAVGCSGSDKAPPASPTPPAASQSADAGAPPAAAKLSADECSQLFRHVLEVKVAEMRRDKAPEKVPTDEQVAKIHDTMMAEGLEKCRAQPRADFECAMAAETTPALEACAK